MYQMKAMSCSTNASAASISSTDLRDSELEEHQLCKSKQCPDCGHKLEVQPNWEGLPAGVKFDPSDQELIEHLEAKVEGRNSKSHPLIDEFILTIEGEDGICYTHPEKLPGVTKFGMSRHFFHRPSKAYTTGTRKRRKIHTECDLQGGETRWHKTGKTRAVTVNGMQKGCKKILVLYTNFGKNRKPMKTNWVMHQYHLGQSEEEKEGELVVSKIFYQTQPRLSSLSAAFGQGSSNVSGSHSSKEVIPQREYMSEDANISVGISNLGGLDMQQFRSNEFHFGLFKNSFDEVHRGDASIAREAHASYTCQDVQEHHRPLQISYDHHQHHPHAHQMIDNAAFHMSMPSNPISPIIFPQLYHHNSVITDDESRHISRVMLQNESLQHQQPQQQHDKMGGSSGSGLEEIIMGCTSVQTKEDLSISNSQQAEWYKYSSFWPNSDNPDHHG